MGEIDLIMTSASFLIFVEVRYRASTTYGSPLETVTRRKQKRIIRTASHYLLSKLKSHNIPCRFDVVGVTENKDGSLDYQWIPQAFY